MQGNKIGAAGGTYDMAGPDRLLARMVHEEILARHEKMNGQVDFLGSFNMMVRTEAFRRIGGFDEWFRSASGEDNDLTYRLQDAGYRLMFVAGAPVAHHHPARIWPYLRTQSRHGFWRVRLYKKHAGRSGGDRYAGMSDFARPPIALLSLALLPAAPLRMTLCAALLAALLALILLTSPITLRVSRRTGSAAMLCLFPWMMILRDYARGLGMAGGFWHFIVRGRK
jgi:GT2 family glycosyltransferase